MGRIGILDALLSERAVDCPDGVVWQVGFRWLDRTPRWPGLAFRRWRSRRRQATDLTDLDPGLGIPDSVDDVIVGVLLIIALVLAWYFVLPVLFVVLDFLVLLGIALLAVLGRVVLRRPWIIEAESLTARHAWGVVGWRSARRGVDQLAIWLQSGGSPAEFQLPGATLVRDVPDRAGSQP